MKKKLLMIILMVTTTPVLSDTWSSNVTLTSLQPLTEWSGGAIRIQPTTATNPAGCSNTSYYDFTYDSGTQETRSPVVAAIYTAFTTGKQIKFYIDGDKCSPAGSPIVRGALVLP